LKRRKILGEKGLTIKFWNKQKGEYDTVDMLPVPDYARGKKKTNKYKKSI